MYLGAAKQLCPDLVCLDYDLESCAEVSELLYETVSNFTDNIEAVSCDELYADISESENIQAKFLYDGNVIISSDLSKTPKRTQLREFARLLKKKLGLRFQLGSVQTSS